MFAQCVSRTFVALALAIALAALPAAGALAAPAAPTPASADTAWLAQAHDWLQEWTDSVLGLLRLLPGEPTEPEGPSAVVPGSDDSLRKVTGDDGVSIDPDG